MAPRQRRRRISFFAWLGFALILGSLGLLWRQPGFVPAVKLPRSRPPESFSVVVIDAGHGGQDSGATTEGLLEKDVTLDLAKRVERLLQEKQIATLLIRGGDIYISLADRAVLANRARDAILVSLHCNDGAGVGPSGIETYFAARQVGNTLPLASWLPFLKRPSGFTPNERSQSLAAFLQKELVTETGAVDRGTKAEQFYMLANVRHPAALVEAGFLTNKQEAARLADANYRQRLAQAISKGVLAYRAALERQTRTSE